MQKFLPIALLTAKAFAQNSTDESPELKKFSHIVKMVVTQITTAHDSKTISKMIQNYGCHCFPGMSKIAGGTGPAQDGIDDLCRILSRCHKCVEMDHGVSVTDQEWDADIGKYRWQLAADNSLTCNLNTDQFKADLCACDAEYAMALASVWDDSTYNYAIWDNKKNNQFNFDNVNVCIRSGTLASDSCCGAYPQRFPYDSTARSCCASSGKTFNSLSEDCCGDGTVANIGAC